MKFQNPSIHGSKVNGRTHAHRQTDRQTDRQAESNMPFQLFQSWGHKNNQRIIFKPHAEVQSMVKTYIKVQKNQNKTVGGGVHTWYLLSIHFYCQNARKTTQFKLRKKVSRFEDYIQTTCTSSNYTRRWVHKAHATIRTEGRTYGRTDILKDGKPKVCPSAFLRKDRGQKLQQLARYANIRKLIKI